MPLRLILFCALMLAVIPTMAASPLRVMSFNVRVPVEADGPDRWQARREQMVRLLREQHADVVGTQELVKAQAEYLAAQLPEYAWFGRDRRGGEDDERMGVFYRRDTLRLLESGDFWLSDTPEVPGSISWGHPLPRMVTWGLFERIDDGRRFYLLNTHFPYRQEDGPARTRAAKLIARRVKKLPAGVPVIVTGDFNDVPGSGAYRRLTRRLRDAWVEAPRREGPDFTFHGFTGKGEKRIDWVLYRGGLQPLRAHTLDSHESGRYPSDHFPVAVDFGWEGEPANPAKMRLSPH